MVAFFNAITFFIAMVSSVSGFKTPNSISLIPKQRPLTTAYATTDAVIIGGKTVTAKLLKSFTLTNADGGKTRVVDLTGQEKSVVVFLRHLG